MSELTPEKLEAQKQAAVKLRALRHESGTHFERRDQAILAAYVTGMSLRAIGSEIGLSAQGILNILNRLKGEQ